MHNIAWRCFSLEQSAVSDHLCLQDHYNINGQSLVKMSDHLVESAHQWLDKVLHNGGYYRKDFTSEEHGKKLYEGVMKHNCYVMDAMRMRV